MHGTVYESLYWDAHQPKWRDELRIAIRIIFLSRCGLSDTIIYLLIDCRRTKVCRETLFVPHCWFIGRTSVLISKCQPLYEPIKLLSHGFGMIHESSLIGRRIASVRIVPIGWIVFWQLNMFYGGTAALHIPPTTAATGTFTGCGRDVSTEQLASLNVEASITV